MTKRLTHCIVEGRTSTWRAGQTLKLYLPQRTRLGAEFKWGIKRNLFTRVAYGRENSASFLLQPRAKEHALPGGKR